MLGSFLETQTLFGSSIADWITETSIKVMETLGGPGAALLIALENIFPPLPSEIILPLAGFTASQGNLSLAGAIIWTTAGSLAGAIILYYLGYYLGRERIRHYGSKLPLVKISDINKAERWFTKHENQAVFFGRMIPVVRSLISIPAGIERMPMKIFTVYTFAGSLIWNSALIISGYVLGEQWHIVEKYVKVLQYVVILGGCMFVAYFIYSKLTKKKQKLKA